MHPVMNIFPLYISETKNLVSKIYSPGSYDSRSWNFDDHCYFVLVIRIKGSNLCTKTDMSFSLENVSKTLTVCFVFIVWAGIYSLADSLKAAARVFSAIYGLWLLSSGMDLGRRGVKAPHEKYFFPNCFQDPTPALKASKKKNA